MSDVIEIYPYRVQYFIFDPDTEVLSLADDPILDAFYDALPHSGNYGMINVSTITAHTMIIGSQASSITPETQIIGGKHVTDV